VWVSEMVPADTPRSIVLSWATVTVKSAIRDDRDHQLHLGKGPALSDRTPCHSCPATVQVPLQ
jgi:hypothetical protein